MRALGTSHLFRQQLRQTATPKITIFTTTNHNNNNNHSYVGFLSHTNRTMTSISTTLSSVPTLHTPPHPNRPQIPVYLAPGIPALLSNPSTLLDFPAFSAWLSTLQSSLAQQILNPAHPHHQNPYSLRSITIQALDFFGPQDKQKIGFVKLTADIRNAQKETLPGAVFLRGGSVAMLVILRPKDGNGDDRVVLTVQPRVPAASMALVELPAGMVDDSGNFAGAAAKEIQEELGLKITADELLELTEKLDQGVGEGEELERGVFMSPGGCDEWMKIYAVIKEIDEEELGSWEGKLTGLRDEGEKITLKVVKLKHLWKSTRDAKALSAWSLWMGRKEEGED